MEWKTISVKVNDEIYNAIKIICEKEGIKTNKFLFNLVTKEVEPVLNPRALPESKGVPQIGENHFAYIPESDSFKWNLDLGVHGTARLSENVSMLYLENLSKALEKGILQRQDFLKRNKKGAPVPAKLLKYGVKKNVSTRIKI